MMIDQYLVILYNSFGQRAVIHEPLAPHEYYNLKPLLDLYVTTNNAKKEETLNAFYNLAPEKPTIYNDLSEIYLRNNKADELIAFYKLKLTTFSGDQKILGTLDFYLGQLYLTSNKPLAKDYLLKARDIFSKLFDKDNQVFQAIDEGIHDAEQ